MLVNHGDAMGRLAAAAPGEATLFQPGGLQIMLMGLNRPLQ